MSGFPDKDQEKVIEHRGRPLVVVAGPGSGKTRTLVERARVILVDAPQSNVAFVTFTRTSRRDTKNKLESVLSADEETEDLDFPRVSTLHGFAKSIVHKAPAVVGLGDGFCVLVPDIEQEFILGEVIDDLSMTISSAKLRKAVASHKNTGAAVVPDGADSTQISAALERYEKLCRFYNAVDIEGLVNCATEIVEEGAVELPTLFFHADEFQDLNESDQRLVGTLIGKGQHEVVVVGDDDQSIYGGRDAKPAGIRELFGHPDWEKVAFETCHRLPPHVLRASQALIKQHHGPRIDKGIKIPADDGRRVRSSICTTDNIEIELVAALVKKEIEQSEGTLSYRNFMVLCPTRAIANTFAKHLIEKWNIPVRSIARKTIPEDLWRILLLLRMTNTDDDLALRQWLEISNISAGEIRQIRDAALAEQRTLFELVRESLSETLRQFIEDIEELRESRDDAGELLKKAKFLAGISELPLEGEITSASGLISRLYEEYGLLDSEEAVNETDEALVTTLHSSKGLEAEVVFIVQLSSRYMPNPSRDRDEELRVLYVGMTRAKKELYLSSSYVFDAKKKLRHPSPSPFLKLIQAHLDVRRVGRAKPKKKEKG
jgi:ATP-dependent DNA helicase UvrD/PcrA